MLKVFPAKIVRISKVGSRHAAAEITQQDLGKSDPWEFWLGCMVEGIYKVSLAGILCWVLRHIREKIKGRRLQGSGLLQLLSSPEHMRVGDPRAREVVPTLMECFLYCCLDNHDNIICSWSRYLSAVGLTKLDPHRAHLWVPVKFGYLYLGSPLIIDKIPPPLLFIACSLFSCHIQQFSMSFQVIKHLTEKNNTDLRNIKVI